MIPDINIKFSECVSIDENIKDVSFNGEARMIDSSVLNEADESHLCLEPKTSKEKSTKKNLEKDFNEIIACLFNEINQANPVQPIVNEPILSDSNLNLDQRRALQELKEQVDVKSILSDSSAPLLELQCSDAKQGIQTLLNLTEDKDRVNTSQAHLFENEAINVIRSGDINDNYDLTDSEAIKKSSGTEKENEVHAEGHAKNNGDGNFQKVAMLENKESEQKLGSLEHDIGIISVEKERRAEFSNSEMKSGTSIADNIDEMRDIENKGKVRVLERQNVPGRMFFEDGKKENFAGEYSDSQKNYGGGIEKDLSEKYQQISVVNDNGNDFGKNVNYDFNTDKTDGNSLSVKVVEELRSHIINIRQHKDDDITVKIKPDSSTEISLRMYVHEGKIVASACLERGDFSVLKSHWLELQESLSRYGVDLGMLYMETGDRRQNYYRQDFQSIESSYNSLTRSPIKSTQSVNIERIVGVAPAEISGWESWA